MRIILSLMIVFVSLFSLNADNLPFLGVSTQDLEFTEYNDYSITDEYGVLIINVLDETAAEQAGLQKGMILRKLNNEKIYTSNQLSRMINSCSIGEKIIITAWNNEVEQNFTAILDKKENFKLPRKVWLGVRLSDDFSFDNFKDNYGLLIKHIEEDSPAQNADLQENDVLLSLNSEKLYSQDQIIPMLNKYKVNDKISLKFWRKGAYLETELILQERPDSLFDHYNFDKLFYELDIKDELDNMSDIWEIWGIPEKLHVLAYRDSSDKVLGVIISDKDETKNLISAGVLVKKVIPETPAALGGIIPNDIILKINDEDIDEFDDIGELIDKIDFDQDFSVLVKRDNDTKKLKITLKPVSNEIWQKYYMNLIDNDMIKVILENDKPLDYYYESLENIGDKIQKEIKAKLKGLQKGPM